MVKKEKEKEFIQFSILFRAEYTEKKKKKTYTHPKYSITQRKNR